MSYQRSYEGIKGTTNSKEPYIYIYIHKRLETIESQVIEPGFVIEVTRAEQRDNEEIQCTAGNELPSSARARARIFKML